MPSAFILSASTGVDLPFPDGTRLLVGDIKFACFIKDMGMLLGKDVIAQLVDEHLDRLSQIKSTNDTIISGLLRFKFVSVLAE